MKSVVRASLFVITFISVLSFVLVAYIAFFEKPYLYAYQRQLRVEASHIVNWSRWFKGSYVNRCIQRQRLHYTCWSDKVDEKVSAGFRPYVKGKMRFLNEGLDVISRQKEYLIQRQPASLLRKKIEIDSDIHELQWVYKLTTQMPLKPSPFLAGRIMEGVSQFLFNLRVRIIVRTHLEKSEHYPLVYNNERLIVQKYGQEIKKAL